MPLPYQIVLEFTCLLDGGRVAVHEVDRENWSSPISRVIDLFGDLFEFVATTVPSLVDGRAGVLSLPVVQNACEFQRGTVAGQPEDYVRERFFFLYVLRDARTLRPRAGCTSPPTDRCIQEAERFSVLPLRSENGADDYRIV